MLQNCTTTFRWQNATFGIPSIAVDVKSNVGNGFEIFCDALNAIVVFHIWSRNG